jgi:hypothetical protein
MRFYSTNVFNKKFSAVRIGPELKAVIQKVGDLAAKNPKKSFAYFADRADQGGLRAISIFLAVLKVVDPNAYNTFRSYIAENYPDEIAPINEHIRTSLKGTLSTDEVETVFNDFSTRLGTAEETGLVHTKREESLEEKEETASEEHAENISDLKSIVPGIQFENTGENALIAFFEKYTSTRFQHTDKFNIGMYVSGDLKGRYLQRYSFPYDTLKDQLLKLLETEPELQKAVLDSKELGLGEMLAGQDISLGIEGLRNTLISSIEEITGTPPLSEFKAEGDQLRLKLDFEKLPDADQIEIHEAILKKDINRLENYVSHFVTKDVIPFLHEVILSYATNLTSHIDTQIGTNSDNFRALEKALEEYRNPLPIGSDYLANIKSFREYYKSELQNESIAYLLTFIFHCEKLGIIPNAAHRIKQESAIISQGEISNQIVDDVLGQIEEMSDAIRKNVVKEGMDFIFSEDISPEKTFEIAKHTLLNAVNLGILNIDYITPNSEIYLNDKNEFTILEPVDDLPPEKESAYRREFAIIEDEFGISRV